MPVRLSPTRTAAAVTAAAGLALAGLAVAAPPASAATTVHFLTKGQWPQDEDRYGDWHSKSVHSGVRDADDFCLEKVLPAGRTQYKEFFTDLDAGGIQYIVRASSSSAASDLVADLKARVPVCAKKFAAELPQGKAKVVSYPYLDVEEGLSRRGVYTSGKGVEFGTVLWAFGRDGRYVTVVELDQIGKESGAPLTAFRGTAKTALLKMIS